MDYSTSISTSYADTYDKTSSQLSDKLTSTDFSQASDDEEYNDKQQAVGYICSRGVSYAHHTGTKQREAQ